MANNSKYQEKSKQSNRSKSNRSIQKSTFVSPKLNPLLSILKSSLSSTVYEKLFKRARIVTCEPKHTHSPYIAEFWCTITSPFFSGPMFLYFWGPTNQDLIESLQYHSISIPYYLNGIDPMTPLELNYYTKFCMTFSVFTAILSTLYHQTLYQVFSMVDACFAALTA